MTPSTTPLAFKVKDRTYTIDKITIGNLMKIEMLKSQLCNGQYGNILANRTVWAEYTLDNVDMFAHLMVFFPKLISDLKVDTWESLDPFDLKELHNQYKIQFTPWFANFSQLLRKESNDQEEDGESTE